MAEKIPTAGCPSQKQLVLAHLQRYGSLEMRQAFISYGISRLSAIIFELRGEGWHIVTSDWESYSKVTGRKIRTALYILDDTKS